MEYLNRFYIKCNPYSRQYYSTNDYCNIVEYKGYEICKYSPINFHICKDGVILHTYAGLNGAKKKIDDIINL